MREESEREIECKSIRKIKKEGKVSHTAKREETERNDGQTARVLDVALVKRDDKFCNATPSWKNSDRNASSKTWENGYCETETK